MGLKLVRSIDPDINLHTYEHLIFKTKEFRNTHVKRITSSTNGTDQSGWEKVEKYK